MNGDAAEEVVRMAVNGADVAIRLVGAGAKNLALLFLAWSRNDKVHAGKTSLPKLISSGDEMHVLSLSKEEYAAFKKQARKKITYAPFLNNKNKDGKVDVVVGMKQEGIVNRILDRIGYQNIKAGTGARAEILDDRKKEAMGMSFDDTSGDSKKTILRREEAQKNAGTARPAGTTPRAVSLLLRRGSRKTSASLNVRARSRRTVPAIRAEISRSPSPRQRNADGQTDRQIPGVGILP